MKRMLSLVAAAACFSFFFPTASAQSTGPDRTIQAPAPVQNGPSTSAESVLPYRADRLLVQLKPEATQAVGFEDSRIAGQMATGLATLDALNLRSGVQRMARSFRAANAQRAAQPGVDRWFTLDVPGNVDIEVLARLYRNDPNVDAATPD